MHRVLIVDDDKLARRGLISMVPWEKCGLIVVGNVANGQLALEFLEKEAVDLAVVDLSMPVMNGLDFIRESRALYPQLQYVALSFHEEFEYVQNVLRLGALDYISKLRMEEEDCTQIFQRIGNLMCILGKPEANADDKKAGDGAWGKGLDPARIERLFESWQGCRWIYDRELFEKQKEELSRSAVSLRQMDRFLMLISQEVEKALRFTVEVPFISEKSEGVAWLGDMFDSLYRRVDGAADFTVLPVCILKAVKYTHEHLTERLKMEAVAQSVNMSRSYFATSFKNITSYTFNNFLRHERVGLAKQLLTERKVKPSEVAEAVGYEDEKYFAHIFWEETGCNCIDYIRRSPSARADMPES